MILEGELADGEEKLIMPTSVVTGGDVEDDGDKTPNVLDHHSLCVEVHDGCNLIKHQGMVKVTRTVVLGLLVV